jgi:hypothetical protein
MKKGDSPEEVKAAVKYARQVITDAVCASIAAEGALEQREKCGEEYVAIAVKNAGDAVAKYNALVDEIKEAQAEYVKEHPNQR